MLLVVGLLCQVHADQTAQEGVLDWLSRSGAPVAAILMPAGFFLSSMGAGRERPNRLVSLVHVGALLLAVGLTRLGVGLLTA